ncbi:hypothetical protein [Wenxinia saemankumensis]|uniref:Flagellar assembly protein FliH n=1 Tax=Wenxinia saemankumensis TaxID=1447782 RepID=A0A1M6G716_9RHOB|nr:hypothetical protein [Wenxinia saemankumensis]SHJ05709.1 hypothetical protein SAMN05444417_2719 [Wenxinia saemankumensis]
MTRHAFLEDFDPPPVPAGPVEEPPSGPSEDWLDGHAAGRAEALAEAEATHAALTADLVAALADLDFAGAEARRVVLDGLQPLFRELVGRFLPDAARATFAPRIAAELAEAAAQDTARPLRLHVAPGAAAEVEAARTALPAAALVIVPDPDLGPLEAVIVAGGAETGLDLGGLTDQLVEILSNLVPPPAAEEGRAHG